LDKSINLKNLLILDNLYFQIEIEYYKKGKYHLLGDVDFPLLGNLNTKSGNKIRL
jgi:hypothetical protein